MDVLVQQGASKGDCVQKIVEKYGIWFTILREKKIPSSGFLGLFPREKVEIEYCLSPQRVYGRQGIPQGIDNVLQHPGVPVIPAAPAAAPPKDDSTIDFVEEKKRVLAAAGKNPEQIFQQLKKQEEKDISQQLILDKLQEIQEKIGTEAAPKTDHPSIPRIAQMLRQNDFSERYTAGIMDKVRKELPLETLDNFNAVQDCVVGWIGESIEVFPIPQKAGRILVLIGPTGVGKTTTIAKLAANYGLENLAPAPISVRIITIDAFRIGAMEQIGKFSNIMGIPISYIDNRHDLRKEVDLYRDETDLILIDTIGRSPKDSVNLGEMKELLDACGSKVEIHLALPASTKTSDIEYTLQQFEPFNYQAVMLTKLDETRHIGNVISALAEKKKPVSYITDGQTVPNDIRKASVVRFLINLEEFRVDREKIEKRFPSGEADNFE